MANYWLKYYNRTQKYFYITYWCKSGGRWKCDIRYVARNIIYRWTNECTNKSVDQFFSHSTRCKISLDRLNEIHEQPNEENNDSISDALHESLDKTISTKLNPDLYYGDLRLENVSFVYDG